MKTSFVPKRGHNYHIIHETKSPGWRARAWTLCGEYFDSGELSTRQPTCPNCKKLDNPLTLSTEMIQYLRDVITLKPWRDAPRSKAFHALVERDYITADKVLTRRGQVIVEDIERFAVPLQHPDGLIHARKPLDMYPMCQSNGRVEGADDMTVSRYEKLRKLEETLVVTCIRCLGK